MIHDIIANTIAGLILALVGYGANELRLLRRVMMIDRRRTRKQLAQHNQRITRVESRLPTEPGKAHAQAQIAAG